jgi:UDP-glucose 4-epimerase
LSRGHRAAVAPEATLITADIGDQEAVDEVFQRHEIEAVMHLAALTSVEESMAEPSRYLWNNVACGLKLLKRMLRHGVKRMIFSSSAAVYGQPEETLVTENTPARPINTYGESKLTFERILRWYSRTNGLDFVILRYFNVAGATKRFGPDHHPEITLIPKLIKIALGQAEYLPIFGTHNDTRDGTCVRDYIHVVDVARANILSLKHLEANRGSGTYNLGNGEGYSVMEVVEAARRVTGAAIPLKACSRRSGDPAELVANSNLAKVELGWKTQYPELESIIESAWQWQKEHPHGYCQRVKAGHASK